MGKIFCLMGKSATGKDSIFRIISNNMPNLKKIVPYTTRPVREGETEGVEYHFVTNNEFNQMLLNKQVIESRTYHTVHGIWIYFTSSVNIDLEHHDYITINTLEGYNDLRKYYGSDVIIPIYIQVMDDGARLQRALDREKKQDNPKYSELCRRFLADQEDFNEEKLNSFEIRKRFDNDDLMTCVLEVENEILEKIGKEKQYHI